MKLQNGFTLLELLCTCTIASILFAIGIPSISSFMQENESTISIRELQSFFSNARYHAIIKKNTVTICSSIDLASCSEQWSNTLIAFYDNNRNKQIENSEELIKVHEIPTVFKLKARFSGRNYFRYSPNGLASGTVGNLTLCPQTANTRYAQQLVANFSGRIRISTDTNKDGYIEDRFGHHLDCT